MPRVLGTIVTRIEESLRVKFAIPRVRTVMKDLVIDDRALNWDFALGTQLHSDRG